MSAAAAAAATSAGLADRGASVVAIAGMVCGTCPFLFIMFYSYHLGHHKFLLVIDSIEVTIYLLNLFLFLFFIPFCVH